MRPLRFYSVRRAVQLPGMPGAGYPSPTVVAEAARRRYLLNETGADWLEQLGGYLGGKVAAPALEKSLADPKVQAQAVVILQAALEDPKIQATVRKYQVSTALWLAGGIVAGLALWHAIKPRK